MRTTRLRQALNGAAPCFLRVGVVVLLYCTIHFLVVFFQDIPLPPEFTMLALQWWVGLSMLAWFVHIAIVFDEAP